MYHVQACIHLTRQLYLCINQRQRYWMCLCSVCTSLPVHHLHGWIGNPLKTERQQRFTELFFTVHLGSTLSLGNVKKDWLPKKQKSWDLRISVHWFFKCEGCQARNHLFLIKESLFSEKKALSPLLKLYNHRHYC